MKSKINENSLSSVILNNGSVTILNSISSFILNFVFALALGLELFGQITLILSIASVIFSFGSLGLVSCITRSLMMYVSLNKNYNAYITLIFFFGIVCSALFFYPLYLLSLKLYSFESIYFKYILILFCIYIFIYFPYMIGVSILESNQKMKRYFYANLSSLIFKYLSIPFLFYFKVDLVMGLAIYFVIPQIILLISIFHGLLKENLYRISFSVSQNDFDNLYNLLIYTLKLIFVTISDAILINYPIIFLSKYSLSEIGLFKLLYSIVNLGLLFPAFLGKSLLPLITDFYLKGKLNLFKRFFSLFEKSSFSVIFVVAICFIFCGNYFFSIFSESEILINYIIFVSLILYVLSGSFVGTVFGAVNKPEYISFCLVAGSLLNIVFIEVFKNLFNSAISIVLISMLLAYFIQQSTLFYTAHRKKLITLNLNNKFLECFLLITSVLLVYLTENLISEIYYKVIINLFSMIFVLLIYYQIVIKYRLFDDFEIKQIKLFQTKIKII